MNKTIFEKKKVFFNVDTVVITCKSCQLEFAVLGIISDKDNMARFAISQGHEGVKEMYCPYCGQSLV